ncbi:hypothetical protein F2Q68_00025088 [Brassica cretica]|uniref:Large ribosomal subunit protein mL43 n=1 Tax=Brassica cretica TaxID=69181 RepID=A0A8S9IH20_BRACR|nr:hypothetical protein F2Q68_00025088 [Brassica cretica]
MTENDQIIGALNDLVEPFDGAMMECDDHANDLLGQDLMDLEAMGQSSGVAESSCAKGSDKDTKRAKSGSKGSAPLGIQTKRTEFLRRGSPRLRSTKAFMESELPALIEKNPQLEVVTVLSRGQHPNERVVCVKNMDTEEVLLNATRLRNSLGRKVVKLRTRHVTKYPSVQARHLDYGSHVLRLSC